MVGRLTDFVDRECVAVPSEAHQMIIISFAAALCLCVCSQMPRHDQSCLEMRWKRLRERTPLLLGGNRWANMSLLFSLSVSWCRLEILVSKYNNWMSSQALYTQLVFCVQMIPFPFVAWQQQSHAKKNKKVIILE